MANRKVSEAERRIITHFSIKRKVKDLFTKKCAKNGISGSRIVENMIDEWNRNNKTA